MKRKEKREVKEVHYDKWQFAGRRPRAISMQTGISYVDYSRMHIQRREVTPERRLATPAWALKDEYLRELVVVYLEERFYIRHAKGTLLERLERIRATAESVRPRKIELLKKYITGYHLIKSTQLCDVTDEEAIARYLAHPQQATALGPQQALFGAEFARKWLVSQELRDYEMQIQNLDTDLVLTTNGGAAAIVAMCYLYYRAGWDSVAVGEELGFKPPHIRQILFRMNQTWQESLANRFVTPDGTTVGSKSAPANVEAGSVKGVPGFPLQFQETQSLQEGMQ